LPFLRPPDQAWAIVTSCDAQYLEMYRGLLGPYPIPRSPCWRTSENTGYAMPSSRSLATGQSVSFHPAFVRIRMSLHNGGQRRNRRLCGWQLCEGLTAYLADHLIADRWPSCDPSRPSPKGLRTQSRPRTTSPRRVFRAATMPSPKRRLRHDRHGLEHVAREDRRCAFIKALHEFYRDNRFRVASFDDIRRVSRRFQVPIAAVSSISDQECRTDPEARPCGTR